MAMKTAMKLAIVAVVAGMASTAWGQVKESPRGAMVETERYRAVVADGVLTSFFNKLTNEEYLSPKADLAKLLPHLPSGMGTQAGDGIAAAAKLFQQPWWEHPIDAQWVNQHYASPASTFAFAAKDAGAVLTYKGLTDGTNAYDDETYSLAVQVDKDTGDLLLTPSATSPRKGVYGCGVTAATLAPDVTIEAPIFDGVRLDRQMKPTLWANRWACFWDYAFIALNGKDKGAVGAWCQDAELKYFKHLFYLIDGQGLSFSLTSMNVPPFDELTEATGMTWRFQAFDKSWAQAAARFRDWRTKNVKLAKRPDWAGKVEFVNSGVNAGKQWLDTLAAYLDNKNLDRTVTFAPIIRRQGFDKNHADNMYYDAFPQDMKAWKASGAKLMAYLQPMIMWTPDAKTDREKDGLKFSGLASPKPVFGLKGGDHHLGEPHWQKWFLDWVKEYIDVGGADGIYHDQSYSCPLDGRGLAVNNMTYPMGTADFFYKAQSENPNSIHGTEHMTETNGVGASLGIASGVHWGTGRGEPGTINTQRLEHGSSVSNALNSPTGTLFSFPHQSEITRGKSIDFHHGMNLMEMRGEIPGNYLQNGGLYNGKTVPLDKFANELWLDRKRATTFVWQGLRPAFPDDFARDVYSYFKGEAGEDFRYMKAPWGSQFVQVQGDKSTLIYGRAHGVTVAASPAGISGWCMYNADGAAGLNPARFYVLNPAVQRPAAYFMPAKGDATYWVEDGVATAKFAMVKLAALGGEAKGSVVLHAPAAPKKVFVNGKAATPRKAGDDYEIDVPLPAAVVAIFDAPADLGAVKGFAAVRAVMGDWKMDLFDSAYLTDTMTSATDKAGKCALTRAVTVGPGGKQVQMHFVVKGHEGAAGVKVGLGGKILAAEVNGTATTPSAPDKNKQVFVTVPLAAGESALLSITTDSGGACTFEYESK